MCFMCKHQTIVKYFIYYNIPMQHSAHLLHSHTIYFFFQLHLRVASFLLCTLYTLNSIAHKRNCNKVLHGPIDLCVTFSILFYFCTFLLLLHLIFLERNTRSIDKRRKILNSFYLKKIRGDARKKI